jgi:hypothetical protein
MSNNTPVRTAGTQFEVVERDVVGDVDYIERVVRRLGSEGLLVSASPVAFDAGRGSYAVVRFRKPTDVAVPGAVAVRPKTSNALAISAAPHSAPAPRWHRPAKIAGVVAVVVAALAGLIGWAVTQIAKSLSAVNGTMVVGFVMIAVVVAILLWLKSRGGGGGHGGGQGMGFHWSPCD